MSTSTVSGSIDLSFDFSGLSSALDVSLAVGNAGSLAFSITYGANTVTISYDKTTQLASASWTDSGSPLTIGEILAFVGFSSTDAVLFDGGLTSFDFSYDGSKRLFYFDLTLSDGSEAFIAAIKPATKGGSWHYAFGFYINETLSLAGLPLVGSSFGKKISVSDIHIAYLSEGISAADISIIAAQLTSKGVSKFNVSTEASGLDAAAKFSFDNIIPDETLNSAASQPQSSAGTALSTQSASASHQSSAKAGKSIGPVHLQSIHFGFGHGDIDVVLGASLAIGPLQVSLDGLEVSNPLSRFDPSFDLQGLGIDYSTEAFSLGGAFLNVPTSELPANVRHEYSGALNLSVEQTFQLDALGSYAEMDDGSASFFVYALADYPLGGPSFFFVTGLAAAFGYNRELIAPPINEVAQFPLVSAANGTNTVAKGTSDSLTQELNQLNAYLPPQEGEYFVGLGVKFESFKIINSFALLIAEFGKELEFDFFATSTYKAPDPQDPSPVALVELEVLGKLIPSQGDVMVQGQLTPSSYLLDPNCHLTGGFAIGLWAAGPYAGDFVYSFGGYGSHYKPPTHYPQNVPAIGLNWQIGSDLSIKGGMYWALTPEIIAAGGSMHAAFNSSFFRAWFDLDAYFLIEWKPFHYEAGFNVDFGLRVRIDLLFTSVWVGFDISAGLQIAGPPFHGTASVSLSVCTIHINFGDSNSAPTFIQWSDFSNGFLPAKGTGTSANRVNINLVSGLVKTTKDNLGNETWIVNPKEICLQTNTFIPSTAYSVLYQEDGQTATNTVNVASFKLNKPGIKPMGLPVDDANVTITHAITLTGVASTCELLVQPITGNAPKAIWGNTPKATNSDSSLISDTLTGFSITPASPPKAGKSHEVSRSTLAWELTTFESAYSTDSLTSFVGTQQATVKSTITNTATARANVLGALGFSTGQIPATDTLTSDLDYSYVPNLVVGKYSKAS